MWQNHDIITLFIAKNITPAFKHNTNALVTQGDIMSGIIGGYFVTGYDPNVGTAYASGQHANQNMTGLEMRIASALPGYVHLSQTPLDIKPGV
jgi:hypothetical protein